MASARGVKAWWFWMVAAIAVASSVAGQARGADGAKVKKATVYIRARVRNGLSQGTGFFAVEKDLVVTNAHVLNMHQSNQAPQSIEVICDSGEPTERVFPAQLLGAVQDRDLAVLRVQGADLPEPLPVLPLLLPLRLSPASA